MYFYINHYMQVTDIQPYAFIFSQFFFGNIFFVINVISVSEFLFFNEQKERIWINIKILSHF